MASNRRIVITGGPGSGKSTLIAALAEGGFAVEPEAGRAIIREQQASGGNALPWADRVAFAERMARSDIAAHGRWEAASAPVFFDRGLPDVAGYLRLCDLPVSDRLRDALTTCRYADPVFIAPFWPDIFEQDAERRQDAAEALRTFETMQAVYTEADYRLVELPRAPVAERVAFVLRTLSLTAISSS